ncbi:coagulation factor XIII B chain-like [Pelodytes ibericus]
MSGLRIILCMFVQTGLSAIQANNPGKGERCGSPPIIRYGDFLGERKLNYDSGFSLEYKCPNYYKPQGSLIIKCEDGVWGDPPICLEPCTAKDTDMERNNIMFRWSYAFKLYFQHDELTQFICKAGFENPKAIFRVKCNRGVIPYPKCYHIGSCFLSQPTMARMNIHLNRDREILPGENIQFECNEGMVPENESTLEATCDAGKLNYPKCVIAKPCTISLKDLKNNNVKLQSQDDSKKTYQHGAKVNVECQAGFKSPSPTTPVEGECYHGNIQYIACHPTELFLLNHDEIDKKKIKLSSADGYEVYYGNEESVKYQKPSKRAWASSWLLKPSTRVLLTPTNLLSIKPPGYPASFRQGGRNETSGTIVIYPEMQLIIIFDKDYLGP